ncbi:hypothetical protein pb186bvf_015159 [Paramecium bursaria]
MTEKLRFPQNKINNLIIKAQRKSKQQIIRVQIYLICCVQNYLFFFLPQQFQEKQQNKISIAISSL